MPLSEFELIERFFAHGPLVRDDVRLGVGDDAAVLAVPAGHQTVAALATVVVESGSRTWHEPRHLGHHVLALALNRLAATGAEPAWATLALSLPAVNESWLAEFRDGFGALAEIFAVQLVGGDTTRGPGVVTVVAHGLVPHGGAVRCDRARSGDFLYVTGALGKALRAEHDGPSSDRMPRTGAGLALRAVASAAADISSGLARGVTTILQASGLGATLEASSVPLAQAPLGDPGTTGYPAVLSASGDLELCFTVTPQRAAEAEAACAGAGVPATRIGRLEPAPGLRCIGVDGERIPLGDIR